MSVDTAIAERVLALLEPVRSDAEEGEDLDPDIDPYLAIDMDLTVMAPDYKACAEKAIVVLKEESKHLQIMAWLALSWMRAFGLDGYRDGLVLIRESLKKYAGSIFPTDPKRRGKAIKFAGSNGRIVAVLKKVDIEAEPAAVPLLHEIKSLLTEIAAEYKKVDTDASLDFSKVEAILDEKVPDGFVPEAQPVPPLDGVTTLEDAVSENTAESLSEPTSEASNGVATELPNNVEEAPETAEEIEDTSSEERSASDGAEVPEEAFILPWDVEELLDELPGVSDAGTDIENTDDQDDMVAYMTLESEMMKRSGTDYQQCIGLCKDILLNRSKHLRVATWLCIGWFKTEQLRGLRDGILLLGELIDRFNDRLYPLDASQKSKILQRLNSDTRLHLVKKIPLGSEAAEFHFSDEKIRALTEGPTRKLHALKGKTIVGQEDFQKELEKILDKEESEAYLRSFSTHFVVQKAGIERVPFEVNDRAVAALRKAGMPQNVADSLRRDLQGNSYVGWGRCYDDLLLAMGEEKVHKYQPILETCLNAHLQQLLEIEAAFTRLQTFCMEHLPADPPKLETLSEIFSDLAERAREQMQAGTERLLALEEKASQAEKATKERESRAAERKTRSTNRQQAAVKPTSSAGSESAPTVAQLKITGAEDALNAIKKGLKYYFEEDPTEEEENPAPRPLTLEPRIYGLSRTFRWGGIHTLPDDNKEEGPNEVRQKYLKNPPSDVDTETLIRKLELDFLQQNAFIYWIDGQQLVVTALEKLGDRGQDAAAEIKMHLAKLLQRFPELPERTFRDKKTPFASPETRAWLEEEVMKVWGSGGNEKILPPILGEDYSEINQVYENACEELPDRFEENALAMHQAIEGETRRKGRFLIRLNLANYYSLSKQLGIARSKFNQLIQEIDEYNIAEWEQALSVSVWQSAYLNNQKLLQNELRAAEQEDIQKQQQLLFEYIAQYDGVLALRLMNHNN